MNENEMNGHARYFCLNGKNRLFSDHLESTLSEINSIRYNHIMNSKVKFI